MSEALETDPAVERLLETQHTRLGARPPRRELLVELAAGLLLLAAVGALVAAFGLQRSPSIGVVLLLVAAYALIGRVEFDVGYGYTTATELVLVPLAFTLPPALLPVVVALLAVLRRAPDLLVRREHPARLLLSFADGWHAVGPALVLAAAGAPGPTLDHWPIFVFALAAQLVFDIGSSIAREWAGLGLAPALQLRLMGLVAAVDVALAPVGLLVALGMQTSAAAVLLVLPLAALLLMFAREREMRIEQALQLSGAYRGTAMLMGDVLEADDAYTGGEHSQGVVALALAVGEHLRLSSREQRDLEFAALLHDIGKLRIPNEIINKPGKLSAEEWEIVRRHPAEGQRMLERVGGRLTEVGRIVRAHHERMDGTGYPDGMRGEQIPLAARIISACDAYSAMTTNRSYRAAMPHEDAVAELRRCTPAQFDPVVTAALLATVRPPERALVLA
ncbi:MAG: metal dependent phosphohydrolase [Solirubrobacterales bacterium]|nr:metal dependent phosphohydrolase [Solirubrobacterales bacterium]